MPEYVYLCESCTHRFTKKHSIFLCDDVHQCPRCSSKSTHRIPQIARVNWNGLPPHRESMQDNPARAWLVDEAAHQQRKERYAKKKELRGETWNG